MYAKVFAQIYDGTLCTVGPWQALVTFQQMLVLADPDGNVDMTAAAIARRTTIPPEIIDIGIAALLQPDPDSRTPTEDGKRIVPLSEGRKWGWRIVNYAHYRALKREEDRREYHREYWRANRSKAATASTVTQQPQPNQPKKETEAKAYAEAKAIEQTPRKRGRVSVVGLGVDELVCLGVEKQHAQDWIASRKAKRLPLTQTALDETKAEAERAGVGLPEAIRIAAANGWGGFKAAWVQAPLAKPRKSDALMAGNIAAAQRFLEGHES